MTCVRSLWNNSLVNRMKQQLPQGHLNSSLSIELLIPDSEEERGVIQDVIRDNEAHQPALISPNSVKPTLVVLALRDICH